MDFFTSLTEFGGFLIGYIIPFLFVLTVVVFFHELGHFLVARWNGVTVTTFSVGFGKEIYGWNDKHGTRWRISWIPLGGYVKFMDDDGAASTPDLEKIDGLSGEERKGAFHLKPLGARAAIVAAGPIANFILAIVIFSIMFAFVGRQITTARVDSVAEGSAAEEAGFQPGDLVLAIDGIEIESFADMQRIVSVSADEELEFLLERGNEEFLISAVPKRREITDRFGNVQKVGLIGITRSAQAEDFNLIKYPLPEAVWRGTQETWYVISRTMGYLYDVVTGREDASQLGGPIRIAQVSGQVATLGFAALIQLAAVLSVSIGLINLFPVPMLDGGHLLYYGIEALRGRPLSDKAKEFGFRVGMALLLMLMIFATWNDVANLSLL